MRSFHRELQDIFWAPKILGTFPFDDEFRLSKKWLAYCFVVRLLTVIGLVYAYIYPTPMFAKMGKGLTLGKAVPLAPSLLAVGEMFFCVIWWVRKRKVVRSLMDNTSEILIKSEASLKNNTVRLVYRLLLLSLVIYLFSYYTSRHKNEPFQHIWNELAHILLNSSTWSSIGMFWDLLHFLGLLFEERTRLYDESSVVSYETFTRLSEMVNDIFELKLLFTVTTFFILSICYLYILLLPLHPGWNEFSVLTAIHVVRCIIPIVIIIWACDYYTNKEKNFNQELYRRIIKDESRMSHRSEKLKFHFAVRQETEFSACGFFTIDRSLLCSMISATTTYLVILLQYDGKEEDDKGTGL